MAVLWLPISVHCELEEIPALQFLSCCPDDDAAPHQDDDCETDGCAVVESGLYKTEERRASLPAPILVFCVVSNWLAAAPVAPEPAIFDLPPVSPPPEISVGWHFSFRTALLPRPPSFVS